MESRPPKRKGRLGWGLTAVLAIGLTILTACVSITSVTPNPATQGQNITISGAGFLTSPGSVKYDGATLSIVSWSDTSIVATLPASKANGSYAVLVTASDGTSASATHTIANPAGMGFIPAGAFLMGSTNGGSDERPVHSPTLPAFWMDTNEVTVFDYGTCLTAGACTTPSTTYGCNWGVSGRGSHPINCVDWNQAASYCAWAGKRLPTEAEWEKGARGTDGRTYPWGEATPTSSYAVFYPATYTAPVGSKPLGDSPYGLHDMAGNVFEWVNDWYSSTYYSVSPPNDPPGPTTGTYKGLRGGSWYTDFNYLRSAYRGIYAPPLVLPHRLQRVPLRQEWLTGSTASGCVGPFRIFARWVRRNLPSPKFAW